MSGITSLGINNPAPLAFKAMDPEHYKNFTGVYEDFSSQGDHFKKLMAQISSDLEKLKAKFASNRSESLAKIIQNKEKTMESLNQVFGNVREAYFSRGAALGERVQAYLNIAV